MPLFDDPDLRNDDTTGYLPISLDHSSNHPEPHLSALGHRNSTAIYNSSLMKPVIDDTNWDFSPVIDLIHSLSATSGENYKDYDDGQCGDVHSLRETILEADDVAPLGNFDTVWKFLGRPLDVPPPTVLPQLKYDETTDHSDDYLELNAFKGVRWWDQEKDTDTVEGDPADGSSPLTKTQSKKQRRLAKAQSETQTKNNIEGALDRTQNQANIAPQLPTLKSDELEEESHRKSNGRKAVIQHILFGNAATAPGDATIPSSKGAYQYGVNGLPSNYQYATAPQILKRPVSKPTTDINLVRAAERKAKLLSMLKARFLEDSQSLKKATQIQKPAVSGEIAASGGIHVFVDASNIMIGFVDALKLARGQLVTTRVRNQPFSFHNFSLILERGRKATKRVLVGSDNFPSIQEAKLIGYETNILEKVQKGKGSTPRQKRYRGDQGPSGQSSGSETATRYKPEKWVEQAVDEILHLKILESIVDAKTPSTIVLATGDAAEAEYSLGFLKMVERALEKGWKVELVSFRQNMSGLYKRKEFRLRWGKLFKIIQLDSFAELLVGT